MSFCKQWNLNIGVLFPGFHSLISRFETGTFVVPNQGHNTKSSRFHCQQKRGISGDYTLQKTTSMSLKMVILLCTGVFSLLRSFTFSERRTKCYTRKIIFWDYGTLLRDNPQDQTQGILLAGAKFLSLQSSLGFMKSSKKQIYCNLHAQLNDSEISPSNYVTAAKPI